MKKFLCLGYYTPAAFEALTPAELQALGETCRPHDERFNATGQVRQVVSLEGRVCRTLTPRDGRTVVHDGPYVEAKELVGSFLLIEAEDLDDAVRVASLHPAARVGEHLGFAIEVHPVGVCVAS